MEECIIINDYIENDPLSGSNLEKTLNSVNEIRLSSPFENCDIKKLSREYTDMKINKKDRLFYARILPPVRIYEVCELIVRTVKDSWFVAIDKRDKRAYLFNYDDIDTILFFKRDEALSKVLDAEKNSPKITFEIDYEDY